MMTFLATVHIIACIALIIVAMLQDSKGGGMFTSQTSSNSVLGASGGASLAVTITKILSAVVLVTCLSIAIVYSKSNKSVIDTGVMGATPALPAAAPTTTGPLDSAATPATTDTATTPVEENPKK